MPASPIPFVPSGHFPLTRGIGLSQGGLLVRNSSPPCERGEGRKAAGGFRSLVLSLPPPRGKVVPKGPDEGGYRGMRRPSNGRMGTSAPTQGYDRFRRGRCPQRPVDNGCTSVVPLIRHGLRPCHLLPCGAKAMPLCRERSNIGGVPLIRHGCAVPPSPRGRLLRYALYN